jgi:Cu+-exporting ATPase
MDTLAQRRLLVEREKQRIAEAKKRFVQSALLTAPVMISGMLMHRSPALRVMEFALSTAILFGSSNSIFRKAWALARQREANMDTLIAIGAGAAWAYSLPGVLKMHHHVYFESAAGICTFVLLGRYLEERAKGKAGEAIRSLIELQAETALRLAAEGSEQEVAIDDVAGRRPACASAPATGCRPTARVLEGASSVDEALRRRVAAGRQTPGDPVNRRLRQWQRQLRNDRHRGRWRHRAVRHRQAGRRHAQGSKLPVQKLADRISARFVPAVGGVAAATFASWALGRRPAVGRAGPLGRPCC